MVPPVLSRNGSARRPFAALLLALVTVFAGCRGSRSTLDRPPAGIAVERAPQLVCFSSDDNPYSGLPGSGSEGGLHWLTALFASRRNPAGTGDARTLDGSALHYTFFVNTMFLTPEERASASPLLLGKEGQGRIESAGFDALSLNPSLVPGREQETPASRPRHSGGEDPFYVLSGWKEAVDAGHEVAIHTHSHPHGRAFTAAQWAAEMRRSMDILSAPWIADMAPGRFNPAAGLGLPRSAFLGFRAPFIEPADAGMAAALAVGLVYDSSIEEGPALGPHRGFFAWPYTFDEGLPANQPPIGRHPGLREIPIYDYVVPPDEDCARYGVPPGLRTRLAGVQKYFQPANGEITGMDWNLWFEFGLAPDEFLATLKHTLDRHLATNRCPMTVGLHSQIYTVREGAETPAPVVRARRAAVQAFLDYALSKPEVRVANHRELLEWLRRPAPLTRR